MRERPILFSDPMVRALLSGQKTQTRRVVNPYPPSQRTILPYLPSSIIPQQDGIYAAFTDGRKVREFPCPYGQPGDRLWVRECHAIVPRTAYRQSTGVHQVLRPNDDHDAAVFRADWERSAPGRWRPSIHMPRWACRLMLEILSVRVERLQDISEADAMAEGIVRQGDKFEVFGEEKFCGERTARDTFCNLWCHINGFDSWAANPWCWVIEFRRVQP